MHRKQVVCLLLTGILVLGGCGSKSTAPAVPEAITEQTVQTEKEEKEETMQTHEISTEEAMTETTSAKPEIVVESQTEQQTDYAKSSQTGRSSKEKNDKDQKRDTANLTDDDVPLTDEVPAVQTTSSTQEQTDDKDKKQDIQSESQTSSPENGSNSGQNANPDHNTGTSDTQPNPSQNTPDVIEGYSLVWHDEFEGNALNTSDWNYELHEPGWVNHELQEYVESDENIFVKDGILTIQALKNTDKDGNVTYTSGRINTRTKHDFKYGRFEARLKVPEGKGFLPAFWMMPTDESLYGTWPKCGEIDIMEVLGDKTDKTYSTLHFGEPHTMKQQAYKLESGDFANEFHVFACDWEPGQIQFYVDGNLIFTENDWFTGKNNKAEIAYPAPYNQPFYLILNLAVGGDWPGNPIASTTFDEKAQLQVDYVRVYQKDTYDENVKKPEIKVDLREPDADGNYVINGNFNDSSIGEKEAWNLLLAENGDASASIHDHTLIIDTKEAGSLDYSVQVIQPDIPVQKGYQYELSFDAYATAPRTIITAITAPERDWSRYLEDKKFEITTEKKNYSFTFDMTSDSDAKGRIEFNLGNQNSTETVMLSNVVLKKVKEIEIKEQKPIVIDGTLQNGDFSNGDAGFEVYIDNHASASYAVNNEEMQVTIEKTGSPDDWYIQVKQNNIKLEKGKWYHLSFDAKSDLDRTIMYALQKDGTHDNDWTPYSDSNFCELTEQYQNFSKTFYMSYETDAKTILSITLGSVQGKTISTKHTVTLDNILLQEVDKPSEDQGSDPDDNPDGDENPDNTDEPSQSEPVELIKNGDFSNGKDEWYGSWIDDATKSYSTFDDGKAIYTIVQTGDNDWQIQLKQGGLTLEQGKEYVVKFDIKCDITRKVRWCFISEENDWYCGEDISLTADEELQYSTTAYINKDSNNNMFFQLSLGKVDNSDPCTIEIDNVSVMEKQ